MIENIRKYQGLIIFGLVIVAIALVIGLRSGSMRSATGGQSLFKIDGRTYNDKEFHKFGAGSMELATTLAQTGDFGLYQFVMSLTGNATSEAEATEQFFINRILLRNAKEDFGIYPDAEAVSDHIRSMRAFTNEQGKFNDALYRDFIEKRIGRLGMTENDLRELASDVLVSQKLTEVIGSGLTMNRDAVSRNLALQNQQIAVELAKLDIDPFEAEIDPTDDEIKEYWELIQDSFKTEELRKFSYVIATPEMPEEPAEEEETIADAAASDEEKAKKAEEKAAKAADFAEQRRTMQLKTDALVDDFTYELEQQQGVGFAELAEENGWKVVTTELFPYSAPPEELDVNLRSSSSNGRAVDELFKIEITSDPISKISQPIAIGENQWLVAVLEEKQPSRPKTFEEAKIEAREQYIDEKAAEAMKTAAEEAIATIEKSMADGMSFSEAAKQAGIAETKQIDKVSSTYSPNPVDEPRTLFQATRFTDPGKIADPITEADRTFIAFVKSREVVKQENAEARVDSAAERAAQANQFTAFVGWLAAEQEKASVQRLFQSN
ncbi:MAG: SurA N-terminal domain-containing protein [Verrucomicrobiota bacterium JB025]|nr:SurA N-terminal domain-containing protein [Verrucomicrobiota bacterium JB025]